MTLTLREQRIIQLTKSLVMSKVNRLPQHVFGHGFLWGRIQIRRAQKNGSVRTFFVKTCFGGVCVADFDAAITAATSITNVRVSGLYINAD